jgi:ABC-type uncharacterized transport system involved in gliding motility auxiliary subunit
MQDGSAFYRFSAFLGVLGLAVFAGGLVWLNINGQFDRTVAALFFIAALLGVLYVIPRWEELTGVLGTRTARQGGTSTLMSVAFIGLLVVGNWWVNRHSPQWDLTAVKRYTLAEQTKRILQNLDRDVKITAFLPSQEDSYVRGTKDLLRRYQQESKRITVEFIDPELNPAAARQYDISGTTVAIFQAGERREETTGFTEQDFTSALLKLTRTERKKIYFLQGHQERDPDSSQQTGYYQIAEALKRENYDVAKISLLGSGVPADAAVLVIAGPQAPLLDPERQAVKEYVDRGGKLFVLGDPQIDLGLKDLLDQWQVQFNSDVVVDPVQFYRDAAIPVPQPISGHRISSSLTAMLLPYSRSVSIKQGAGSEFVIAPLLRSTDRAWGETNLTPGAQAQPNPGEDTMGPLNFAIAVNKAPGAPTFSPNATPVPAGQTAPIDKGRLVVIGNSEFATNAYAGQVPGNRDFFVNSINWLAEDEDLISIRAVPNEAPPIFLTNQTQGLLLIITVVFIPLTVLLAGLTVWWQRR